MWFNIFVVGRGTLLLSLVKKMLILGARARKTMPL